MYLNDFKQKYVLAKIIYGQKISWKIEYSYIITNSDIETIHLN